jgi:ubiquinol-cytochrome c reductase iron-sulfur subunit
MSDVHDPNGHPMGDEHPEEADSHEVDGHEVDGHLVGDQHEPDRPHPAGVPVPLPLVRADDPHLQPAARHPRRVENIITIAFLLGIVGVIGFGVAYWVNAKPWVIGLTLGLGLSFLGFGLTAWGKYLMPQGPFVEERHTLASSPEEQAAMAGAIVERGTVVVRRRGMLGALLGVGLAIFGVVALFPLLRSLGPLPGKTLIKTNWRRGSLLVDAYGRAIHVDAMTAGGIVTVFPAGFENNAEAQTQDQTILIRTINKVDGGLPNGYVAFSKACTHLGCPVGLYESELELLVCPCHQSMFNVADRATPTFGPAPRPLPQLPLMVDSSGYLRAAAGYNQPVGPGYWERP